MVNIGNWDHCKFLDYQERNGRLGGGMGSILMFYMIFLWILIQASIEDQSQKQKLVWLSFMCPWTNIAIPTWAVVSFKYSYYTISKLFFGPLSKMNF